MGSTVAEIPKNRAKSTERVMPLTQDVKIAWVKHQQHNRENKIGRPDAFGMRNARAAPGNLIIIHPLRSRSTGNIYCHLSARRSIDPGSPLGMIVALIVGKALALVRLVLPGQRIGWAGI